LGWLDHLKYLLQRYIIYTEQIEIDFIRRSGGASVGIEKSRYRSVSERELKSVSTLRTNVSLSEIDDCDQGAPCRLIKMNAQSLALNIN